MSRVVVNAVRVATTHRLGTTTVENIDFLDLLFENSLRVPMM